MCGIFGGYNISSKICEASINLIDRGNDGISIDQIEKDIFFKLCVFTNLKKSQHFNILFRPMFRKLTLTSRLVLHTMQCNVM